MKKLALALIATGLAVTAACSAASTGKPLPQAGNVSQTTAATAAKAGVTADRRGAGGALRTTEAPTTTTVATTKVTTCDAAREAFLTGTQAQINAALVQLQADKTADATAREYADYYLHRDATDTQMRQMDVDLIRTACSI